MTTFLYRIVLMLTATTAFVGVAATVVAREPEIGQAAPVQLALLQAATDTYTVQSGDTLFGIGRKLGVSPEAIAEANGLAADARIKAGIKLRVPGVPRPDTSRRDPQAVGRVITVSSGASTYVVKSGDTVDAIANRLGMTRKAFADLNGLEAPYALSVGRRLKGPPETRRAYVVADGDSLEAVARRFSVPLRTLAADNGLRSTAVLRAGQRLMLPEGYRDRGPIRATAAAARSPSAAAARTAPPPSGPPEERDSTSPLPTDSVRILAGGRVISVKGKPVTYTVRRGDTVDGIADRLGLSRRELAGLNGLEPPYTLRPGQVLKGPSETQRAYVAVSGDSLSVIARRFSVTPRALAAANDLRTTAVIRSGQRLILPDGARDRGPVRETVRVQSSAPPSPRPAPAPPESVSSETDAPLEDPAAAGPPELRVEPGQPAATRPVAPAPTPPASTPVTPSTPVTSSTPVTPSAPAPHARPATSRPAPPQAAPPPAPTAPAPTPRVVTPPTPATPPPVTSRAPSGGFSPPPTASTTPLTDAQIAALGKGRFLWPLRGEILSDFGPKGTGQRNDGINIRAVRGAPVRAAAAGEVVYAGDQVPGFGNLVLIKHPEGWVTAYAHLSSVDVRIQQKVLQGQQIGEAGDTGGVSETQLHFEIRYAPTPTERARPVSPSLLLPR
ncbi:MAG: LysM peptidoglycan-binding domain-containing protein [Phenylobacterium sp.]|nr:LysM peptidoglycan-binding domain-containing protein [Phenylobacterium sp.]